MGEMIGDLDERTLLYEFGVDTLEPLANAYWALTHGTHPVHFGRRFGAESDTVQVFFPGPVVRYKMFNQSFRISIFQNGGNVEQARELHRQILAYATRNGNR